MSRADAVVLVTGATGKVGQQFIARFLADEAWAGARVRALCHNRLLDESERLQVVRGSISERAVVEGAMDGVTHVVPVYEGAPEQYLIVGSDR